MAGSLDSLETKLNEVLVTNAPFQLPENFRKWLATYAWIFALIGLVFGIFSLLILLPLLGFASVLGTAVGSAGLVFFAWLSFAVLLGYVILLGIATPKLKRMEKSGWNLIFYSTLFFFAYDVFNALRDFGAGAIFTLIWNVLVTTVSLYFIFQMRSYFMGKKPAAVKPVAPVAPKKD